MSSRDHLVTAIPGTPFHGMTLQPGATILYRFEDVRSPLDDPEEPVQLITLRQYRLQSLSASRKTAVLVAHHNATLKKPKRISLTAEHPWALPSPKAAIGDFYRRKQWQLAFLCDQLRRTEAALVTERLVWTSGLGDVFENPERRSLVEAEFTAIGASALFEPPMPFAP